MQIIRYEVRALFAPTTRRAEMKTKTKPELKTIIEETLPTHLAETAIARLETEASIETIETVDAIDTIVSDEGPAVLKPSLGLRVEWITNKKNGSIVGATVDLVQTRNITDKAISSRLERAKIGERLVQELAGSLDEDLKELAGKQAQLRFVKLSGAELLQALQGQGRGMILLTKADRKYLRSKVVEEA
jgi:ribosomal protein S18 acetylase RimI-like enzyme